MRLGSEKLWEPVLLQLCIHWSKEFLVLVLISIVIAVPVGWIIVENLLKQFAYRIEMSMLVFTGIALGAILIAMLTVSFQAYKATGINPAEALKVE